MLRFKFFLKESDQMASTNLDMVFINHALKITSFNLRPADFTTTKYKREIQYLFNTHFFPRFDLSKTINTVDMGKLNTLIASLKREDMQMFRQLHNYNLKGVGPGEATLFFLINTCKLGGGSSAGVDVIIENRGYEVKAVKVSNNIASDFKLGGNVPLSDIINDLDRLREELNLNGRKTEISGSITKIMREKAPEKFKSIEKKYADLAYEYFKDHEVIFVNNSSGNAVGNIEAVKYVKPTDIMIERVTSGTVKPLIRL